VKKRDGDKINGKTGRSDGIIAFEYPLPFIFTII
jgi:hypothetical protein